MDYNLSLKAVEELKAVCPKGMSLTQFALKWILMFDAVTCAIPGAKRPIQAEENISASDFPALSEQSMNDVKSIYEKYIKKNVHHLW